MKGYPTLPLNFGNLIGVTVSKPQTSAFKQLLTTIISWTYVGGANPSSCSLHDSRVLERCCDPSGECHVILGW